MFSFSCSSWPVSKSLFIYLFLPPCVNSVIPDPPNKDAAIHGEPSVFHDIATGYIPGSNTLIQNPVSIIFCHKNSSHQSFHFHHPPLKISIKKTAAPSSSLIIPKNMSHNSYLHLLPVPVYKILINNLTTKYTKYCTSTASID